MQVQSLVPAWRNLYRPSVVHPFVHRAQPGPAQQPNRVYLSPLTKKRAETQTQTQIQIQEAKISKTDNITLHEPASTLAPMQLPCSSHEKCSAGDTDIELRTAVRKKNLCAKGRDRKGREMKGMERHENSPPTQMEWIRLERKGKQRDARTEPRSRVPLFPWAEHGRSREAERQI